MVAPRKYPDELRERAVRMVLDVKQDPMTRVGACRRIGQQLGINSETLRGWVTQTEIDIGLRSAVDGGFWARLGSVGRSAACA